jgi:AcrR family transcriptional regulator
MVQQQAEGRAATATPDDDALRARVLDAADRLYYRRGIQSVGMDELRTEAGVPLKRLYRLFGSKDAIVAEVLRRRHAMWEEGLTAAVAAAGTPRDRLLAIYDYLAGWFDQGDFNGCIFINSFGELGGCSPEVAALARDHKAGFQSFVADLVAAAGGPPVLAAQLAILAEGAQTTAAISGSADAAAQARAAAETLIGAAGVPAG